MSATTPVERVAQILTAARFRRVPTPLAIGGVEIDAAAAFVGEPPSPDLVMVGDTVHQSPRQLQQSMEGLGRALDMMRSRRPLTLVVVGPRPESSALAALSRYARVLAVGEAADETSLRNWLAILMPLRLPRVANGKATATAVALVRDTDDDLARELVALADLGREDVAARLAAAVDQPFLADAAGPAT